jgi:hypothetical protein
MSAQWQNHQVTHFSGVPISPWSMAAFQNRWSGPLFPNRFTVKMSVWSKYWQERLISQVVKDQCSKAIALFLRLTFLLQKMGTIHPFVPRKLIATATFVNTACLSGRLYGIRNNAHLCPPSYCWVLVQHWRMTKNRNSWELTAWQEPVLTACLIFRGSHWGRSCCNPCLTEPWNNRIKQSVQSQPCQQVTKKKLTQAMWISSSPC